LIMMIVIFIGVFLFLASYPSIGFSSTRRKIERALPAQWSLSDFLRMKPIRGVTNQYYYFSEEVVKSLGHRYMGRLDGGVLHLEEAPILDCIIERKFPMTYLPREARSEDVFQAGLYALALLEGGVSCSSTRLVIIYCLQEKAKRCLAKRLTNLCWRCSDGKTFVIKFKPNRVLKKLQRLDEVWYNGRKPKPTNEANRCRVCPYSSDRCNYSLT